MKIYHHDPVTGAFRGVGQADPDPLEKGEFLIPAHATTEAPPAPAPGAIAVRENDAWTVKPDHRGRIYWLADGTSHEIDEIGIEPPAEALDAAPPMPIAVLRTQAKVRVDAEAEDARLAFITPGSGQALVYEAKRRESADCLANHSAAAPPDAGVYPMLDAEVGITVTAGGDDTNDAYEAAVVVDAIASIWTAAGAAIETVRLAAKRAIEAASGKGAIDTIFAGLAWPKP